MYVFAVLAYLSPNMLSLAYLETGKNKNENK